MISLRSQRTALKLSQSELARQSGVARQKICAFELGGATLTPDEQRLIREALQREAERLCSITFGIDFENPETPGAEPVATVE